MPSITNHGNSNQNHSKIITSHLSEWLLSTRQQISGAGKDIREKRNLVHYWWKCKSVQPLWKTVQRLLKKLKIELPYYPAIPSPGTYQKKMKTLIRKDTHTRTPTFIAVLFTVAKIFINMCMCVCVCVCVCVCIIEYYSTIRKNKILVFVTWLDLDGIMLSETRHKEKDKYSMISYTCRI